MIPDGQKIAKRMSRVLKKTTTSLKKAVEQYNANNFTSLCGQLPNKLTAADAMDPGSVLFMSSLHIIDVCRPIHYDQRTNVYDC